MTRSFALGRDEQRRRSLDEIDVTIEDELWKAGLYPDVAHPVVDLEAFIEQYLGARLDTYAALPSAILGQTEFHRGDPPVISVNRLLTEAAVDRKHPMPGVLGRWRATLGHEASHVIFHGPLFDESGQQAELFRAAPQVEGPKFFRCTETFFRGGVTDWREVQANRGMAALLMPRRVFQVIVVEQIERLDLSWQDRVSGTPGAWRLAAALAEIMDVSKQAATIRLETLNMISPAGQDPLRARKTINARSIVDGLDEGCSSSPREIDGV